MAKKLVKKDSCKIDVHALSQIRSQLQSVAETIIENCDEQE